MKFNEYEYIRPDYNIIKEKYLNLINDFKNSATADEQYTILKKINAITNNVDTMSQLCLLYTSRCV